MLPMYFWGTPSVWAVTKHTVETGYIQRWLGKAMYVGYHMPPWIYPVSSGWFVFDKQKEHLTLRWNKTNGWDGIYPAVAREGRVCWISHDPLDIAHLIWMICIWRTERTQQCMRGRGESAGGTGRHLSKTGHTIYSVMEASGAGETGGKEWRERKRAKNNCLPSVKP
jgi:hypothetical protein